MYLVSEINKLDVQKYANHITFGSSIIVHTDRKSELLEIVNTILNNATDVSIVKLTSDNMYDAINCIEDSEELIEIVCDISKYCMWRDGYEQEFKPKDLNLLMIDRDEAEARVLAKRYLTMMDLRDLEEVLNETRYK